MQSRETHQKNCREGVPHPQSNQFLGAGGVIAIFGGMTVTRLAARVVALLLCWTISATALTSDQEVDDMLSAASELDAAGKGAERDALEEKVRIALRGRIAADSSTVTALSRLDRLEEISSDRAAQLKSRLSALRAKAAASDTSVIRVEYLRLRARFPASSIPRLSEFVVKPEDTSTSVAAVTAAPAIAPSPGSCGTPGKPCLDSTRARSKTSSPPTSPTRELLPRCPDGPPEVRILRPSPDEAARVSDSALVLQIRLRAPCPLERVQISRDSTLIRILNVPAGRSGSFELDDAISVSPGSQTVTITACDTFQTCSRAQLSLRPRPSIPPWIPWTSGGLVLLGLATGIFALFRRPSNAGAGNEPKQARGLSVRAAKPRTTTSQPTDIQESLRAVIADAEKETSRGPRLISRMNTAIPAVDADAQQLQLAFRSLLKLPLARAGLRGTVLVATGRGPVNMEVVLEDNGPDIEDSSIRSLFDAGVKNRERQGLDKELAEAADILGRLHGHLAAEPRIDGGLRLRIRLPLPSTSGPRAASLLK